MKNLALIMISIISHLGFAVPMLECTPEAVVTKLCRDYKDCQLRAMGHLVLLGEIRHGEDGLAPLLELWKNPELVEIFNHFGRYSYPLNPRIFKFLEDHNNIFGDVASYRMKLSHIRSEHLVSDVVREVFYKQNESEGLFLIWYMRDGIQGHAINAVAYDGLFYLVDFQRENSMRVFDEMEKITHIFVTKRNGVRVHKRGNKIYYKDENGKTFDPKITVEPLDGTTIKPFDGEKPTDFLCVPKTPCTVGASCNCSIQ